jgi:hypothetical protein
MLGLEFYRSMGVYNIEMTSTPAGSRSSAKPFQVKGDLTARNVVRGRLTLVTPLLPRYCPPLIYSKSFVTHFASTNIGPWVVLCG